MTQNQIENMTEAERTEFVDVKCHSFDETMSLEEYTDAICGYIYIWRRLMEGRDGYTWQSVSDRVKTEAPCIKGYYDERSPVDAAAMDVDFV